MKAKTPRLKPFPAGTVLLLAVLIFGACAKKAPVQVVMSGWGGDPNVNNWITLKLRPYIKETTGLDLVWSPMNIDEILGKLDNEIKSGAGGNIDIVWINGENFRYAKDRNYLYGDILGKMENAGKYLDLHDPANLTDFGYPTDGLESPWGRAQFVFIADSSKVREFPRSAAELFSFLEKNPGVFTYPESADFTGSAFLRTLIYDLVGYETVKNLPADYDTVAGAIKPVVDYLNALKPYLWEKGRTYPKTLAQLDTLYQDGTIWFVMDYNSNKSYAQISGGLWTEDSRTFVWEKGTPSNTHFLAIPANSGVTEEAVKVINGTLSPVMQASKAELSGWGDAPVLDFSKLSAGEKALFVREGGDSKALASLPDPAELASHGAAELAGDIVVLIEEIWRDQVLGF
jgi:putative spermidine/putrescine transport system substrate-binding protein